MPAIPIHDDSPLRPSQPTAITPQTASGEGEASSVTPSRTVPASVSATATATTSYTPPPPQPGARPTPPKTVAVSSSGPLPPQPGARPVLTASHIESTTTQLPSQHPPPQMFIPPPGTSHLPTKSTAVHGTPQPPSAEMHTAAADNMRRSLEHPPGYAQNPYVAGVDRMPNASMGGRNTEDNTSGGVWDGVANWAAGAGEKLADAEKQAWKWALGK